MRSSSKDRMGSEVRVLPGSRPVAQLVERMYIQGRTVSCPALLNNIKGKEL